MPTKVFYDNVLGFDAAGEFYESLEDKGLNPEWDTDKGFITILYDDEVYDDDEDYDD